MMIDPDGEFAWFVPVIFGVANLAGEAIRGNVNNFKDGLLAFGAGALQGTLALATSGGSFAAQGGGWLAVSQALSSQLPGVTIPLGGGGSSLTLSPSLIFGSHNFTAGINGSLNIQVGDVGLSYGFGASYGKGLGPSGNQFRGNLGVAASYNSDNFGATFGVNNYFSGKTSQETGILGVRIGKVSITSENDFPTGDQGDRYRSAAVEVGYRDFTVGFNLFTGDSGVKNRVLDETYTESPNYAYGSSNADRYRHGLFYASYRGSRVGIDSEGARAFVQNKFHDLIGSPHFKRLPMLGYTMNISKALDSDYTSLLVCEQ